MGTLQYIYPWVGVYYYSGYARVYYSTVPSVHAYSIRCALYYSTTWVGMHTYIHGCVYYSIGTLWYTVYWWVLYHTVYRVQYCSTVLQWYATVVHVPWVG